MGIGLITLGSSGPGWSLTSLKINKKNQILSSKSFNSFTLVGPVGPYGFRSVPRSQIKFQRNFIAHI
jgi:hypothetical protein